MFSSEGFKMSRCDLNKMDKTVFGKVILGDKVFSLDIAPTYGQAVDNLRSKRVTEENNTNPVYVKKDGSKIYRPLTLKEHAEWAVENYDTKTNNETGERRSYEERIALFQFPFVDTCTAIISKKDSTKFIVVPECEEAIDIPKDFSGRFKPVEYDSFKGLGNEYDSSKGAFNRRLQEHQSKDYDDDAWREELGKSLHNEYKRIIFDIKGELAKINVKNITEEMKSTYPPREHLRAMGWYVNPSDETSMLQIVSINGAYHKDNMIGSSDVSMADFNSESHIVHISPRKIFADKSIRPDSSLSDLVNAYLQPAYQYTQR